MSVTFVTYQPTLTVMFDTYQMTTSITFAEYKIRSFERKIRNESNIEYLLDKANASFEKLKHSIMTIYEHKGKTDMFSKAKYDAGIIAMDVYLNSLREVREKIRMFEINAEKYKIPYDVEIVELMTRNIEDVLKH